MAWPSDAYSWDARGARILGRSGNRDSSFGIIIVCVALFLACVLVGRAYSTVRVENPGNEGISFQYGRVGSDTSSADHSRQDADSKTDAPPADGGSKAEDGTGGDRAQSADDGISPNWRDREFSIDGHKFTLGSFTVGEFMDQTGWTIDESVTVADGQINLGQGQKPIYLHHPSYGDRGDVFLMISVSNEASATADIQDCTVTSIAVAVAPHSGVTCPDFEIVGGISLRGTSPDQAKRIIPARPVQDSTKEGHYGDYSYTQRTIGWYGGNAEYGLILAFDEDEAGGELYGIGMIMRVR